MAENKLQKLIPSLADMPPQHAEWLVDGYIPQGCITMISGEAGHGKSTWALALAGAISEGKPFAGLQTKKAPVLYMDKENPHVIAQQRVHAQHTKTGPDFLYWGMWVEPEPCPMYHDTLVDYVKACEVKPVIVVDSLAAFYAGDENDSTQMRAWFRPVRLLAKDGATVIVIHHTGKSETSKEYRGSSDVKGAIDIGFTVKKINPEMKLEKIAVKAWKTRFLVVAEQEFSYSDDTGMFTCYHGPKIKTTGNNGFASVGLPFGR